MDFIRANIVPVLEESKRRPFKGRLLLLGQGDIYFSDDAYRQMAQMDGNFCATFCVATKGDQSTGKVIPQQGWYSRQAAWKPCSAVQASMADLV